MLNSVSPLNKMIANSNLLSDKIPHFPLKTTEKTKVYTANISRGLSIAQNKPKNEPLYLA